MHSAVASSTAMYLTMFTTLTATINALIIKSVNVQYMLVLCVLTIASSIPGIICQPKIREGAGGRTQITIGILISALIIIAASVGFFMITEAIIASEESASDDVSAFKSYC